MSQEQKLNGFPIKRVKLSELSKAPYNPRKISEHDAKALQKSLETFGTVEPIIWNKKTSHVVGGHQRLDALLALGETESDVLIVDLPEEQEQSLNIALNRISGEWDNGRLSDILLSLHEDMRELTGFSQDEIAALLPKEDGLTDPDAVPEVTESVAKLGDIWQLGEHRLMCGDSTDAGSVALLMNGERCDMVFTDPPYGVKMQRSGSIVGDESIDISFDIATRAIKNASELNPNSFFVWCGFRLYPRLSLFCEDILGRVQNCIVWKKKSIGLGKTGFRFQHELCIFVGEINNRTESDVWEFDRDESPLHPTMKPIALVEHALKNTSKIGDCVLDMFLGSGSTLIACEQLSRKCYGMELDPHYCDVIIKRWEDFTGQKAVKVA